MLRMARIAAPDHLHRAGQAVTASAADAAFAMPSAGIARR